MTQELHYTSAPAGLKPGTRGFCTVISTRGMDRNLATLLETLSGYRHAVLPQDSRYEQNPIVHSHLAISVGGQRYHILSRIGAYGVDYTNRTNKFAHHVVLTPQELVPAGPAWVLSHSGFMESSWQGKPRTLPTGRHVPDGDCDPQPCHSWSRQTGDAGWAGMLVESFLSQPSRDSIVIFPLGADVLSLFQEALALVPPDRRWEVSFSTYFTKLPPGISCSWRAVLSGSPEAEQAGALRRKALVIDLTGRIGSPPDKPYVEAARTGRTPWPLSLAETPAPAGSPSDAVSGLEDDEQSDFAELDERPAPVSEDETILDLFDVKNEFRVGPPTLRPRPAKSHGELVSPRPVLASRRRFPVALAVIAAVLLIAIGGVGGFVIAKRMAQSPVDRGPIATASDEPQESVTDESIHGLVPESDGEGNAVTAADTTEEREADGVVEDSLVDDTVDKSTDSQADTSRDHATPSEGNTSSDEARSPLGGTTEVTVIDLLENHLPETHGEPSRILSLAESAKLTSVKIRPAWDRKQEPSTSYGTEETEEKENWKLEMLYSEKEHIQLADVTKVGSEIKWNWENEGMPQRGDLQNFILEYEFEDIGTVKRETRSLLLRAPSTSRALEIGDKKPKKFERPVTCLPTSWPLEIELQIVGDKNHIAKLPDDSLQWTTDHLKWMLNADEPSDRESNRNEPFSIEHSDDRSARLEFELSLDVQEPENSAKLAEFFDLNGLSLIVVDPTKENQSPTERELRNALFGKSNKLEFGIYAEIKTTSDDDERSTQRVLLVKSDGFDEESEEHTDVAAPASE